MKKRYLIILFLVLVIFSVESVSAVYFLDITKISCGNIDGIPEKIPELTRYAIVLIEIIVPIILVIMGSIDLFKGITAQKEDEAKKGQQMFIKRLIYAALIFFVIVIVKLLVSVIVDSTTNSNIVECIDCFLSDEKSCKK